MKGSDLRCPRCHTGAVDVAPNYDFDDFGDSVCWGVSWTCAEGHKWISGVRSRVPYPKFEHMEIRDGR